VTNFAWNTAGSSGKPKALFARGDQSGQSQNAREAVSVLDFQDFDVPDAFGGLDTDLFPFFLADQGLSQG